MKRFLDISLAVATLPLWGSLALLVALVLLLGDGRPVLFRQTRAGLKGLPFTILKFRTMRPGPGTDMERLTRLGRFLRRTSLDELPQLVNILKGDMSLVGPRPLPVAYVARYAPEQARRLDVRPGLTGWAQVNGRNALSWEEKFAYDTWYVDHQSLALDLRILFLTFAT
ncbi:MAG TPA: sugar transferase, partial [Verrucomicrobia bacterium]|nr:sugar transferase [Verrucomicrobiota bacterium]